MQNTSDVIVVGAGPVGAAVAWRCAQRGLTVTLVDPDPDRGAWRTAAGMLAPVTELHYAETALLRLNLESARRYRAFCDELSDVTGLPTGYAATGTVSVAWDAADHAALRDLQAFAATLGLACELLGPRDVRRLEPSVAPGVSGGLLAPHDHQVDPRLLHAALTAAAVGSGVRVVRGEAAVTTSAGRVTGVRVSDGSALASGSVVIAAGAWSSRIAGMPGEARLPVRPVKGQTLRLRLEAPPVTRIVRGAVRGNPVYVVPRRGGEVVVGASSEERGFDVAPRAGAVYELLRDAQSLVPELGEAALVEVCTGLRPGSPDNAPLLGPTATAGLVAATGHYRNGILLTPVTSDAVAETIDSGVVPELIAPFSPLRTAGARAVPA
jgi:glycine oxidase